MERLTKVNMYGSRPRVDTSTYSISEMLEDVLEKLAVYEDTGFSPDEVEELANKCFGLQKFYDYMNELYLDGLEVANWHKNGDLEPFDNFFESAEEYM